MYDDGLAQVEYPIWLFVTGGLMLAGSVVVALGCLALVRRAPGPALLGTAGGLLSGTANLLYLADAVRTSHGDRLWLPVDAFRPLSYAQSVGYLLIAVALALALLRTRRVSSSAADSAIRR